jgi:transposase-like protein
MHPMSSPISPAAPVTPAPRCPVCRSLDVKTTAPVATDSSYWRCLACGEVWNLGRRESHQRSRYGWSGR